MSTICFRCLGKGKAVFHISKKEPGNTSCVSPAGYMTIEEYRTCPECDGSGKR